MTISSSCSESHPAAAAVVPNLAGGGGQSEVVFVKCDCCGLTEECTETYIAKVRERYQGRWICGLCAEAVKYEIFRSGAAADHHHHETTNNNAAEIFMISTEEALNRHMNFCNKFRHPPPNPTKHLISAMKQLLKRSLSSTTTTSTTSSSSSTIRSSPTSPKVSESCFPTLAS